MVIKIFDEKFKIRVSLFIRQILEFDAISLGFVKNNGEANINAFLNKLIPNLLKLKKEQRSAVLELAKKSAYIKIGKPEDIDNMVCDLIAIHDSVYFNDEEHDDCLETVWIRPTKENISVFDEIIESETEITGLDKSNYIRNMLNEYSRFPKYKKEQIAFMDECHITLVARDTKQVLKFRYENQLKSAYVFGCVYDYLQEQGNYVLCYDMTSNIICRYQISEISALNLLNKKHKPSEKIATLCKEYLEQAMWISDEIIEVEEE